MYFELYPSFVSITKVLIFKLLRDKLFILKNDIFLKFFFILIEGMKGGECIVYYHMKNEVVQKPYTFRSILENKLILHLNHYREQRKQRSNNCILAKQIENNFFFKRKKNYPKQH